MSIFLSLSACTLMTKSTSCDVVSVGNPLNLRPASSVPSNATLRPPRSFDSESGNLCAVVSAVRPSSILSASLVSVSFAFVEVLCEGERASPLLLSRAFPCSEAPPATKPTPAAATAMRRR